MPKASIIVPMYNSEKTIKRCVESLICQTEKDIEILLIDDGSTDSTVEICRALKEKDGRLEILCKENGGVSSSRNCGILHAKGDFLLFCDSDDTAEDDWCEKLVEKSSKDTLSICEYGRCFSDGTCSSVNFNIEDSVIPACDFLKIGYGIILGSVCNKCFSRNIVFENNILFDESICFEEDVDFVLEYIKHCKTIILLHKTLYNYYYTENSLITKTENINEDLIVKIYNKCKDTIIALGGNFSSYKKVHYMAVFSSLEQRIINEESTRKILNCSEFRKSIKYANRNEYDTKYLLLLKFRLVKLILKLKKV